MGFAKVTGDLSERKRMEALEEEGRHVTEFLAMLAHELRNPLAPIRNAVGILGILQEPSPEVVWCRDVIDRQAGQLSRLVDDLLDVTATSAETGKVTRSDVRKTTFVSFSGIDGARQLAGELCRTAISALAPFGRRSAPPKALAEFVADRRG